MDSLQTGTVSVDTEARSGNSHPSLLEFLRSLCTFEFACMAVCTAFYDFHSSPLCKHHRLVSFVLPLLLSSIVLQTVAFIVFRGTW